MKHKCEIPDFRGLGINITRSIRVIGKTESMKFFKDRFINQGWEDSSFQPWTKSKHPFVGKRTLMNTNNLMNSLVCTHESDSKIIIENTSEYAAPNNEGATITVTERMKNYFWWQYRIHRGRVQYYKNGNMYRNKENVSRNNKAEFCKAMALKPVGSKIRIPKRQFMGNSKKLMSNMDTVLTRYIDRKSENITNE